MMCGDIELNPGPMNPPTNSNSSMSLLTSSLSQMGLEPVDVIGDGNCFFRAVSHQINGTESNHSQIRALAIQNLINCPEQFIESNTEQSWLQYLQNMSRQGTWADHIVIYRQLQIHII